MTLSDRLLRWYRQDARSLPWRAPPGGAAPDPYRVWLSEIMLQQTTVAAVRPYYAAFLARWPTVEALAGAEEADVMAAWAGLGYYARARNLHACAKIVTEQHGGRFPDSERALRTLPGIGEYTGAAIAAIAFGEQTAVVDANVERVITRHAGISDPLPGARKQVKALVHAITPEAAPGDFAQAMMDLGATICTARNPKCSACPISETCEAGATGDPERFPVKPKKKAKPHRFGTAFWLENDGKVLLIRRPSKGLLGGMRALPSGPWEARDPGTAGAPSEGDWRVLGAIEHVFTHFSLTLSVAAKPALDQERAEGEWWPIDTLEEAGLPTVFAKAASLGIAQQED